MAKKKHTPKSEMAAPQLPPGVKLLRTLKGHTHPVMSVEFSASGGMLASGDVHGIVKVWEATSAKLLRTLEGHSGAVNSD